jgi:hypothetical protein
MHASRVACNASKDSNMCYQGGFVLLFTGAVKGTTSALADADTSDEPAESGPAAAGEKGGRAKGGKPAPATAAAGSRRGARRGRSVGALTAAGIAAAVAAPAHGKGSKAASQLQQLPRGLW